MRKTMMIALLLGTSAGISTSAMAQEFEGGHGPGVGIEENLGGLSGGAFVWDAGKFRIDVLFGLAHITRDGQSSITDYGIGGRVFFVVHRMERADFALGGGLAIEREEIGDAHETNIHVEAAAQIRVFLASNVALSGSLGLVIVTADNGIIDQSPVVGSNGDGAFGFGGQLLGGFGATYYFK